MSENITLYSDYDITDEEESESHDDIEEESETCTYFRHPVKGHMKVTTFDDCMEIIGILRLNGDNTRANYWKTLAFQMDDAPVLAKSLAKYFY